MGNTKLANPAPLGLMGFGMTTILLNLHNVGYFALDGIILAMGIFYGGIAQIFAGLLEYPQYSRPEEWHGRKVPEVLLSGHHGKVDDWRKKERYKRTMTRRPDLFSRFDETSLTTKHDRKVLAEAKAEWAAERESPAAE